MTEAKKGSSAKESSKEDTGSVFTPIGNRLQDLENTGSDEQLMANMQSLIDVQESINVDDIENESDKVRFSLFFFRGYFLPGELGELNSDYRRDWR